jgi:hypothetical protein
MKKETDKPTGIFKNISHSFNSAKYIKQLAEELERDKHIVKKGTKNEKKEYMEKFNLYNDMVTEYEQMQKKPSKFIKFIQKIVNFFRKKPKVKPEELRKQKMQELIIKNKQQKINYKQNNKFMR